MNFKFIERLLRTNNEVSGEVPDIVYKEIAVNILACFAHYETMASSQSIIDRIPALSTTLSPNETSGITKEALHILINISVTKEGLVRMLDLDVLRNIFEVYSGTKDDDERQLCTQLLLSTYTRSFQLLESKAIPSLNSGVKYSLQKTTLPILASLFNNAQDKLKIDTLANLYHLLISIPEPIMNNIKSDWIKNNDESTMNKFLDNMRLGLQQILSTKVGDQIRDQSITITSYLLRYFGPDWLFSWLKQTKKVKQQQQQQKDKGKGKLGTINQQKEMDFKNANFPVLLIHLVSVESRVMIDVVHDQWLKSRTEENNNKLTELDEEKDARQNNMIPIYFEILEATIEYLASQYDEEKESGMDSEVLLKIRKALTEVMDAIMEMLRFMQDTAENEKELDDNMIAQASIRIISVWLAEEGFEM
ncbi:unnamed protein product [Cunninghamella echinulata]